MLKLTRLCLREEAYGPQCNGLPQDCQTFHQFAVHIRSKRALAIYTVQWLSGSSFAWLEGWSATRVVCQCHCRRRTRAVTLSIDCFSAAFCSSKDAASLAAASSAALLELLHSTVARCSCTESREPSDPRASAVLSWLISTVPQPGLPLLWPPLTGYRADAYG